MKRMQFAMTDEFRGLVKGWAMVGAMMAIMLLVTGTLALAQIAERLDYLRNQTGCRSDIAQFCNDVHAGGGRLYRCLEKNKARLTKSCRAVLPEGEKLLRQAGILGGGPAAPKIFKTSEDAVAALIDAAKKKDKKALLSVLGKATEEWIISGDQVQDANARDLFVSAYDERHVVQIEEAGGETRGTLFVGSDGFPFPIPLVKGEKGWAFDPELGREEILDRRIGRNELTTILVLLAITDAQFEYAGIDWDGDGLLEFATKFRSGEGQRDGLYWPSADDEPLSPLGPLVVLAAAEGYTPKEAGADNETNAYHGYRFKLLTKQGPDAPGGTHDYVIDNNMVGGFAVLAWPEKYGASGVMTFMVSHHGDVYETDLGPETQTEATAIDEFNPGDGWRKVAAE